MTPAEHYQVGEATLAAMTYQDAQAGTASTAVLIGYAVAHYLAALAAELGVPTVVHDTQTPAPSGAGQASSATPS